MKKLLITLLIISAVVLYIFFKPFSLDIKEYRLHIQGAPESFEGFKIIHFSDTLFTDENINNIATITNTINSLNADTIVFTGDLIKEPLSENNKEKLIQNLSSLESNYKYFIKGDQDNDDCINILIQSSFTFLDNSSSYIFNNTENPILLVGGDNIASDSIKSDENITPFLTLALIHKPDYVDNLEEYNIDFAFAGHSLGGEVRIPFFGSLFKSNGAKKYTNDKYKNLFVSYGIGLNKSSVRIFNNPSVNVYRITSN